MFTFLLVSPDGSIPVFVFSSSQDADSARREALALLNMSPERSSIEVWDERERRCVVRRQTSGRTGVGETAQQNPGA